MTSLTMCAARLEACGKSVHRFDRRVSSDGGFRGGVRGLTGARSAPAPTTAGMRLGTHRGRGAFVVRANENDQGQDAYNKAMQEYSKTPFEYRHDLGLCKCPTRRVDEARDRVSSPPLHSRTRNAVDTDALRHVEEPVLAATHRATRPRVQPPPQIRPRLT